MELNTLAEKESPRLLVVTSTYPRWPNDHEPGFVHELSRRLTEGFEVRVLTPHHAGAPSKEQCDGVKVRRYRYAPERLETLIYDGGMVTNLRRRRSKWLLLPLFFLAQLFATWRQVRIWRPAVIHAHWLIPQGLVAALLSVLVPRFPPFLVTSHGTDLNGLRFWPMPTLKRFVMRRAAGATVVSSAMLDTMRRQSISAQGVRVEPMGVDLTRKFTPDSSVHRSSNEILFVGRLIAIKGLRYLIEAMPAVLEQHPDAFLTIAGFGPEEPALRRQAETLGLQGTIQFLGPVPQDQLPDLYRRAALLVAPFVEAAGGDQEGLGLVTVEAIGCGCPVVVSDLPAVRDVVDNSAMRVPPGHANALATAIVRVLNTDSGLRGAEVEALRKRVIERFDWNRRASAYSSMLVDSVAASRGGGGS